LRKLEIVYYSGVWDLFHVGHLKAITNAAKLGDMLIVGVTTDEFTSSMKLGRPILPFEQRRDLVYALSCVNDVTPVRGFLDFTPFDTYQITVRAVGPDYGKYEEQKMALGEMKRRGIRVASIPQTPGISTTSIIERIRNG